MVVDKPDTSQRLRFWVDEDGDGFDAGDLLLTSTAVDDDWLGGYVGLFKGAGMTTVHQFDDFKLGFDDDSDDTLDADEVVLHDDFDSATITLTHDDNGNLSYDGVYEYVYDFLNRLVKVKYAEPSGGADLTVAEYEYDGMNRRIRKHVQSFGEGVVPGSDEGGTIAGIQAGNRHEHYYYAGWRVIEERNNSDDVLAQTVWSTEYIDAPVCRDRNTDVYGEGSDDDCLDDGGSERYFYHQGPNYRVWALTDESGDVVERYDYDAYGEARLYAGHDSSVSAELGNALFVSSVGNPYLHQGLRRDDETGLHENRMRAYHSRLGRFIQRDPMGYIDSVNLYRYVESCPWNALDWEGTKLTITGDDNCKDAVNKCLNKLSSDEQMKALIDWLRESETEVIISCGKVNVAWEEDGEYHVGWDPTQEELGSRPKSGRKKERKSGPEEERKRDPCAALIHELAHAKQHITGKPDALKKHPKSKVSLREEEAIRMENRARYLCGNKQRKHYRDKPLADPGTWPPKGMKPKEPNKPKKP